MLRRGLYRRKSMRPMSGQLTATLIFICSIVEAGKVSGSYYYDSVKQAIVLKGEADGPQLRMEELDANGQKTATFYGVFVSPDRIEGVWTVYNPAREGQFRGVWSKIYPFYLQAGGGTALKQDLIGYKEAWEGTWRRPISTGSTFGEITISFTTDSSFWFELFQFSGANSRQLRRMAVIEGDEAVFRDGRGGEMRFTRKDGQIVLKTNEGMSRYLGAGVVFDGEFTRVKQGSGPSLKLVCWNRQPRKRFSKS